MTWLSLPTVEGEAFSWLTEEDSLTERLKEEFGNVKVDVMYEGYISEKESEYMREVIIQSDDLPMIYAKTLLKKNDIEDAWNCIKSLGQQSLANILFKDPKIFRRSLSYRICKSNDALYLHLKSLNLIHDEVIWLRQSKWEREGKILLLVEVFLSNLFSKK
ncbi:MAG: chorismate lyase [Candidatus Methylopumilus sp.]|nr:chorismate lyase [Candidatus Methylopumilus sp.]